MPRARRRRSRSPSQRSWLRTAALAALVAIGLVLVVGSVAEVHAQSGGYRSLTTTGYAALASPVAQASNRTGTQLATAMAEASELTNQSVAVSARARLQQELDQAVASSQDQATLTAGLVPPPPSGTLSSRFALVMHERAVATTGIRDAVDRLLGMTPLPLAGAPADTTPPARPLSSIAQASAALTASGVLLQRADGTYRLLRVDARAARPSVRLPASVWVPAPVATAPLGPTQLGAAAGALSASPALVPVHQLVITALGLDPPAVASGGVGIVADGCVAPQSVLPGPAPTLLPPTSTVTVQATVTNCGTVVESHVGVTARLALADPAGTAPPGSSASGGTARATVTIEPGTSAAPDLAPLTVASGHRYTLTVSVAVPAGQSDPAGSTQEFLVQISG